MLGINAIFSNVKVQISDVFLRRQAGARYIFKGSYKQQ